MREATCGRCGQRFESLGKRGRVRANCYDCSPTGRVAARRYIPRSFGGWRRWCQVCQRGFVQRRQGPPAEFCSSECRRWWHEFDKRARRSIALWARRCKVCERQIYDRGSGNPILGRVGQVGGGNAVYCSTPCRQFDIGERNIIHDRCRVPWRECRDCGSHFVGYWNRSRPLCATCRVKSGGGQRALRDCIVCGREFLAERHSSHRRRETGERFRQTCSRECGQASIARNCIDCGASSGAKKRCGPCLYERSRPKCPTIQGTECRWCGRFLVKWGRGGSDYCSRACWDMVNDSRRKMVTEIHYVDCRECGDPFVGPLTRSFCSGPCARRAANRDRRHRERVAGVGLAGSITLREVADRDGWRCHICHKAVPDRESKSRSLDPTIDHLIPLAAGGEHVPENVALAHFLCNSKRGAVGPAQLRLAS